MALIARDVLVTGATGFMGRHAIPVLAARGHRVRALARSGSVARVPPGATAVVGDALDPSTVAAAVRAGDTVVHLVGTPSPSPTKAGEFERVDLASARVVVGAASEAGAAHLVYVSVAQPAPIMRSYVAARAAAEEAISASGLPATVLRPWYVLGPGRWWPVVLLPLYALGALLPLTRDSARRLGLVTVGQMVRALTVAVESPPPAGVRIVDVPAIRRTRLAGTT